MRKICCKIFHPLLALKTETRSGLYCRFHCSKIKQIKSIAQNVAKTWCLLIGRNVTWVSYYPKATVVWSILPMILWKLSVLEKNISSSHPVTLMERLTHSKISYKNFFTHWGENLSILPWKSFSVGPTQEFWLKQCLFDVLIFLLLLNSSILICTLMMCLICLFICSCLVIKKLCF